MPLVKNIHLDAVLTNISRAVANTELVSTQVWPVVPVKKDSDVYYRYDQSNLRPENTEWAPRTIAKEINWETSRQAYATERHALQELVEDDEIQNADAPIQPMSDSARIIAEKLMIRREKRLATKLQAAGTYPAGHTLTLAAAKRWDNFTSATSDPNADVAAARIQIFSQTARKPNVMILPREVFENVREHPRVLDRIKYTQVGVITAELLANLFDIEKVIVTGAMENTANEAQTDSLAFIWGKKVYIGWVTPNAALRQPSWGYHLQSQAMQTERWRDEERKGTTLRTSYKDTPELVTPAAGFLIDTVIA